MCNRARVDFALEIERTLRQRRRAVRNHTKEEIGDIRRGESSCDSTIDPTANSRVQLV